MIKVLVFGAGAIGRGYVPWILPADSHRIDYVEKSPRICEDLRNSGSFVTYMTEGGQYIEKRVAINTIYSNKDITNRIVDTYDYVVTCVGPRQFLELTDLFLNTSAPVVCFENDRDLVGKMKLATGRNNIYFGIPDVISSNTAGDSHLEHEPFSLITESGPCFVEAGAQSLGGHIQYVPEREIVKQWTAKLYIHNTPHCIAAYLGSLVESKFLHEAMKNPAINAIVRGAANEMKETCVKKLGIDDDFSNYYLEKEIARFENELLFDPISRIAREPFRKLALDNRLIGAAALAIGAGVPVDNIVTGIIAAFHYDNPEDADHHIKTLLNSLSTEDFLQIAIGLHSDDVIYDVIIGHWDVVKQKIEGLLND